MEERDKETFILDLAGYAVDKAEREGATEAEAFITMSREISVKIEKLMVKGVNYGLSRGVGIRVIMGNKVGFSYTSKLNKESIDETIRKAVSVAKSRREDKDWRSLPSPSKYSTVKDIFDVEIAEITPDHVLKAALSLTESIKLDERIKTGSGEISAFTEERGIINSHGVEGYEEKTAFSTYAYAVAVETGETSVGYDYQASTLLSKVKPEKVGGGAAELALKQLGKRKIDRVEGEVVFHPFAVRDLMKGILFPELSGSNVYKKRTPFFNRLGKEIASKNLTVKDNGLLPGGLGSSGFDDEGTPCQKTVVVDRGTLKSFIYDNYWAGKMESKSTGNGFRDYRSEPLIQPSNIVIDRGGKSLDEMIGEVGEGLYVYSLMGTHTANIPSGEFSVVAYLPFKIEGGEIKYPVKQAMISGNIQDILREVNCVAREVRVVGDVFTPAIRVSKVSVSA